MTNTISMDQSMTLGVRLALVEAINTLPEGASAAEGREHLIKSVRNNDFLNAGGMQEVAASMYEKILANPAVTDEKLEQFIKETKPSAAKMEDAIKGLEDGNTNVLQLIGLKGDVEKFEQAGEALGIKQAEGGMTGYINNYVGTNDVTSLVREPDPNAITDKRKEAIEKIADLQRQFGGESPAPAPTTTQPDSTSPNNPAQPQKPAEQNASQSDKNNPMQMIMGLLMAFMSQMFGIESSNIGGLLGQPQQQQEQEQPAPKTEPKKPGQQNAQEEALAAKPNTPVEQTNDNEQTATTAPRPESNGRGVA